MDEIFRIAGALLIFLAVAEAAFRKKLAFLPIGGDHIAQTAVVLGLAFVIFEIMAVLHL